MSIEIQVEPYCKTCPEFDPENIKFYSDDRIYEIVVACSRRRICNNIREHLYSYVNSEKKDDLDIPKFKY